MLITPEYQKLCAKMHIDSPGWGDAAGKLDITHLLEYCEELKTQDVLDYGCGKGELAKKFPFPIKEYDPAIPGKEAGNVRSDFVVCLDTLEHIEPTCLKDVLADLWKCTAKLLYCSIASTAAVRNLPDGRNAHLIQQDWEWWKPRLNVFFHILGNKTTSDRGKDKTEIHCLLAPRLPEQLGLGQNLVRFDGDENPFSKPGEVVDLLDYEMVDFGPFQPVAFFPDHLEYALKEIPRWWDYPVDPDAANKRVAIIGYGPSLRETIPMLKELNYDVVFSCSGAYSMCLEHGVVPTYHVEIDWKPHKYLFTKDAQDGTKFLVSAVCSQKLIDNVKHKDSYLTFIEHGDQIKYPEGAIMLSSGYDVGQHAIIIAHKMGYRNFDLFGFDYCFDMEKHRHAGPHGGRVHHLASGRVGDKLFYTSKTMFAAVLVFEFWLKQHPEVSLNIYSDTLLLHFLEGRQKQREEDRLHQQPMGVLTPKQE